MLILTKVNVLVVDIALRVARSTCLDATPNQRKYSSARFVPIGPPSDSSQPTSRAILAGMVAEFLTGIDGLGKLFLMARADLKSEQALGAAVIAAIASLILFYLAGLAEKLVNKRLT